jgi:hypothetical protein
MTIYHASKDGASLGTADLLSEETLRLGDTDGTSFIRFTGVTKKSDGTVHNAKLVFKAHASDVAAASLKVCGLLGVPAPNVVGVFRDDFTAGTLDLAKWKYDTSTTTKILGGQLYSIGETRVLCRVKLTGDFDIRARLTSTEFTQWPGAHNHALLLVMYSDGAYNSAPPLIGTYDYRLKRVGSTGVIYHKETTSTDWIVDYVETWPTTDCVAGIWFDIYSSAVYDDLGWLLISSSTIIPGQTLYSNIRTISQTPCMVSYQYMVTWPIEGGVGGAGVFSYLLDTRVGTCRFKIIHNGSSIAAYYGVNSSWTLLYSVDNPGLGAEAGIIGNVYATPAGGMVDCSADYIVVGYSGDLVYLTDAQMPTLGGGGGPD